MRAFIIATAFLVSACYSKGKHVPLEADGIQLVLLFDHDGCKIYRFRDGSNRMVYWSDCRGQLSYDLNKHSGKTSHVEHNQTLGD